MIISKPPNIIATNISRFTVSQKSPTRHAGSPRIAPDQHGATTNLPGANTVATRTVPDYPGQKNRPGLSRMTPAILNILKPPWWGPGPCRTMQDHAGPSRTVQDNPGPDTDLTPDQQNFSPGQSGTLVWLSFNPHQFPSKRAQSFCLFLGVPPELFPETGHGSGLLEK